MKHNLMYRGTLIALLFLFLAPALRSQNIAGTVIDGTTNEALPGATIRIKNTSKGAITDADGNFRIDIQKGEVLTATYVGYEPQEIVFSSQVEIIFRLSASTTLTEVVVTGLGVNKEKNRLSYATQEVKGEGLVKAREPNVINSLTGKVSGLTVGASPELLGAPEINMRGSNPIIIVDGVPINSDTWNINADDIESVNVLKGPAAAAIYGSRSIDGAIMITTKKGNAEKGRPRIEFNSSQMLEYGFNAIPKVQDEYGPGDHGRYSFVDGRGGGLNDGDYDIWGPRFEGQLIPQYDSPVDPVTGERQGTPWVARGKNNLQTFLRPGFLSNNNISVSTSTDRVDMRYSTSYNYQQGIVPNTQLNIANFNVATGLKMSDKIRVDANINYNRQFTDNFPEVVYGPNSMIYNVIIWGAADWSADELRNYWQPGKEGVQQLYAEYQRYNNPWFLAYEWNRGHYKTDIFGQTALSWQVLPSLELKLRTAVTTYDMMRNEKFPYSATVYGREEARGDYREDNRSLFENNTDVYLNFEKRFNRVFDLKALAGANLRTFRYNSSYTTTNYLNVPGLYNFSNSANPLISSNFNSAMQTQSAYYSLDFGIKNGIFITHTGRVDHLSTLPKKNNTFFYPSAGLSVVVSQFADLGPVSLLKLRSSFANVKSGLTTRSIGPTPGAAFPLDYGNQYQSSYDGPSYGNASVYASPLVYDNQPGSYYTNAIVNSELKPLSRRNYEVGLEGKLFRNRIGLDLTYFQYIDGPQIFEKPISEASGYTSQYVNAVKTKNAGWELALNGTPFKNAEGFSWDVTANWWFYRETLEELPEGVDRLYGYFEKGDRLDAYYSSALARDQSGNIIHDASGRAIRVPYDKFLGYSDPDWSWSLVNRLSWKNLTFGFQFDGRVGGVMTNYIQRQTFRGGRHIETTQGEMGEARLKDWENQQNGLYNNPQENGNYVGEGVQLTGGTIQYDPLTGAITNYGDLTFSPNTTKTFLQDYISRYYATSEANLMSKTFSKLREVTITWNVPDRLLKNGIVRGASVSLVGRNLLYFAEKKDIDLDQYIDSNYSGLQSPTMKRYGININLRF